MSFRCGQLDARLWMGVRQLGLDPANWGTFKLDLSLPRHA
jgi:hypothetical protein